MKLPARIIWFILWAVCVAEVKPCDFPQIKHGRLYDEERHRPDFPVPIGKEYNYYCKNGFVATKSSYWDRMKCTAEGWVPKVPCRKQCVFHSLENGFSPHWETAYIQDESVEVDCYLGYGLPNGQNTITCTEDGWSPPPKCVRMSVKCLPVSAPENGRIISGAGEPDQEYSFGQVVQFECNAGFKVEGQKEIYCSENGHWSNETPKCVEIICENPYIPNGIYSPHRIKHKNEDEIRYECRNGFYPGTKRTVLKCTSTGWVPAPRCTSGICDIPKIKHGYLNNEGYAPKFPIFVGKDYNYQCNNGFVTFSGNDLGRIRCTPGGWEPEVPCQKQCVFSSLENGHSPNWQRTYLQDQSVKVNCYPGYSLPYGQNTITCTEDGWSPPPKCVRIIELCDFPKIKHGHLYNEGYRLYFPAVLGQEYNYRCNNGFVHRSGNDLGRIQCTSAGWEPKVPCQE